MKNTDVSILIVDDERLMADSLRQNLAEEGYAGGCRSDGC
jgi:hypothetical protein